MTHKAILLNKAFSGDWLKDEDHIGHEIIDLILADDRSHYVYFAPWGSVPNNVVVEGDSHFRKERGKEYQTKYLVLTSSYHKKEKYVDILYVIELERKMQNLSAAKAEDPTDAPEKYEKAIQKIEANYKWMKDIIDEFDIEYNGKKLYQIYPLIDEEGKRDRGLYVSFKAKRIYRATETLSYELNQSIILGNHFVIKDDDKYATDYVGLIKLVEDNIENGVLEVFTPNSLLELKEAGFTSTFFDLIDYGDVEQAFTNILHSVLKQGNLLYMFCERFKKDREVLSPHEFKIKREQKVVDGRMDVCAINDEQKVVIENKINSNLNGVRADSSTQLSIYYQWARENTTLQPLCFLTYPDIHEDKLIKDIAEHDPQMVDIYTLVSYGQIADFLEENREEIPNTYEFERYIDDVIKAFRNLSYKTKEPYYAQKFLKATL